MKRVAFPGVAEERGSFAGMVPAQWCSYLILGPRQGRRQDPNIDKLALVRAYASTGIGCHPLWCWAALDEQFSVVEAWGEWAASDAQIRLLAAALAAAYRDDALSHR